MAADLPHTDGLYGAFAYGSRGLVWAALGAELIASQLEGEPWPLERDLAEDIDPARFLLRALRQGTVSYYSRTPPSMPPGYFIHRELWITMSFTGATWCGTVVDMNWVNISAENRKSYPLLWAAPPRDVH